MKVEISGVKLSDDKKKIIEKTVKSKRAAKHMKNVSFDIKKYSREGLRHKVVISAQAQTDFGKVHADAVSWRFTLAVRSVCKKLAKQISRSKKKRGKKSKGGRRFVNKIRNLRK